jgi:hypothetical protein
MYIIETYRGQIHIDADELLMLKENQDKPLIFFRQGAVNPKQIVRVIEDTERKTDVLKLAGESKEEHQQRLLAQRSDDIFADIRDQHQPRLFEPNQTELR